MNTHPNRALNDDLMEIVSIGISGGDVATAVFDRIEGLANRSVRMRAYVAAAEMADVLQAYVDSAMGRIPRPKLAIPNIPGQRATAAYDPALDKVIVRYRDPSAPVVPCGGQANWAPGHEDADDMSGWITVEIPEEVIEDYLHAQIGGALNIAEVRTGYDHRTNSVKIFFRPRAKSMREEKAK